MKIHKKEGNKMKATGIVRCLDDLGRITIPREIRKLRKLESGTPMEYYVRDDGEILLKKYMPSESCVICGSEEGLQKIKDSHICTDCIQELKQ